LVIAALALFGCAWRSLQTLPFGVGKMEKSPDGHYEASAFSMSQELFWGGTEYSVSTVGSKRREIWRREFRPDDGRIEWLAAGDIRWGKDLRQVTFCYTDTGTDGSTRLLEVKSPQPPRPRAGLPQAKAKPGGKRVAVTLRPLAEAVRRVL
jgi:hypothetical protein